MIFSLEVMIKDHPLDFFDMQMAKVEKSAGVHEKIVVLPSGVR
jgi:hypothetical protein